MLQHRGQEGCGIVSMMEKTITLKKEGLVGDNFTKTNVIKIAWENCHRSQSIFYNWRNPLRNIQPFLLIYMLEIVYAIMEIH